MGCSSTASRRRQPGSSWAPAAPGAEAPPATPRRSHPVVRGGDAHPAQKTRSASHVGVGHPEPGVSMEAPLPTTDSMHYLNQAAGGLMPDSVLHAVSHYMQREQALGAYITSQQVQPQLQQLYARLAELLHCHPAP